MTRVTVSVPATSANLGPGFDSFGLALDMANAFSAELAPEWSVQIEGEGAGELRTDAKNPVAKAMREVFTAQGEPHQAARIICNNRIPTGRGLGSSAAAIVGGMLLANELSETPLGRDRIFELAAQMEGHPDNVAAALVGGFTMSWIEDGKPDCVSLQPAAGLAAILVVSSLPFKTKRARKLLPAEVPHRDAAFNASRSGLLVAGIALGRGELLAAGLQDRLHEQYRLDVLPGFAAVREALIEAGATGAVLSGAGPTVIGLVTGADDAEALRAAREVVHRAEDAIEAIDGYRRPVALAIDRDGASVVGDDRPE